MIRGIPRYEYVIKEEDEMEGFHELFVKIREKYREREVYLLEYTKNVEIKATGNYFEYNYVDARGVPRYFRLDRIAVRGFKRAVDRKEEDDFLEKWDVRFRMRKEMEEKGVRYVGPIEYIGYRYLTTGVHYKIEGPLIVLEKYPEMILNEEVFRRYLYHNLQNDDGDDHPRVYKLMRNESVLDVDIYPSRESADDGQLKIAVDVVLAVEDALYGEEEELRILALGTAAPLGHKGGTAYDLIPEMAKKFNKKIILDMFDPNEIPSYYEDELVKVSKFREPYQITQRDLSYYHLLLDDVYVGMDSSQVFYNREWDPDELYQRFKYFSIKAFESSLIPRNRYHQVAKTNSKESRSCSRRTRIRFQNGHRTLGGCGFCRELRYTLREEYSPLFYKKFLKMHKYACVPAQVMKKVVEPTTKYAITFLDDPILYHVIGDIYEDPRYLTMLSRGVVVELSSWEKYTADLRDLDLVCVVKKGKYYECTHEGKKTNNICNLRIERITTKDVIVPFKKKEKKGNGKDADDKSNARKKKDFDKDKIQRRNSTKERKKEVWRPVKV